MKFLLVYGSIEGQTAKIIDACKQRILVQQHAVRVHNASQVEAARSIEQFDACLIAAPVHQQRHPDEVVDFVGSHVGNINKVPSAFISVSLSAAFDDGQAEAQSYVDRFLERTGLETSNVHLAAGALRFREYDYFQEQIIRHIVLKDRAPAELSGDQEFTDWEAIANFVDGFVAEAEKAFGPQPVPESDVKQG